MAMAITKPIQYTRVDSPALIRELIHAEMDRTGGIFRLAPAWVGRPGIILPGNRLKLRDIYMGQDIAVNERWLASTTFADNGIYNKIAPSDHGLSYMIIDNHKIRLCDALDECGQAFLGSDAKWDVLAKFFDNRNRIPHHLHPCDEHCKKGLKGKPESYHFPDALNMNRNEYPLTAVGIHAGTDDEQILSYLQHYFKGDNRLTELSGAYQLMAGTGYFMPPCTLHAPGSLVTYELQVASDVTCIPESRVNDVVMPADLLDRDLPVSVADDGIERVSEYILDMIRCPNSGNEEDFNAHYFRPPIHIVDTPEAEQDYVIYRCGCASERENPDFYSAKRLRVKSKCRFQLCETRAFGAVVLGGHGSVSTGGKKAVPLESVSMFRHRQDLGGDEIFVAASAADQLIVEGNSLEDLLLYQHFASGSNPAAGRLQIPAYRRFAEK